MRDQNPYKYAVIGILNLFRHENPRDWFNDFTFRILRKCSDAVYKDTGYRPEISTEITDGPEKIPPEAVIVWLQKRNSELQKKLSLIIPYAKRLEHEKKETEEMHQKEIADLQIKIANLEQSNKALREENGAYKNDAKTTEWYKRHMANYNATAQKLADYKKALFAANRTIVDLRLKLEKNDPS